MKGCSRCNPWTMGDWLTATGAKRRAKFGRGFGKEPSIYALCCNMKHI